MHLHNAKRSGLETVVHRFYSLVIARHVTNPLIRQRIKLLWYAPGYWPLFLLSSIPLGTRLKMLLRFLRIDWNVLHGHTPFQCAHVCRALADSLPQPGETMIEAGCWKGGSSAKWSILCKNFRLNLAIYDSFEGVEYVKPRNGEYDFSGEYAAEEQEVLANLKKYGEADVCRTIRGWFSSTMAAGNVSYKVRLAYIDCDTAKGTKEALIGIIPSLTEKSYIFSQDCHISSVIKLLTDPATWMDLRAPVPIIKRIDRRLVRFSFN